MGWCGALQPDEFVWMQVDPNHVKTLCALATLERRSNHPKAAKAHLRKALSLQPTNPVALRVQPASHHFAVIRADLRAYNWYQPLQATSGAAS